MDSASQPSLRFRVSPSSVGPAINLAAHVWGQMYACVPGNLLPITAVIVRLKIEAIRQVRHVKIAVDAEHFGSAAALFKQAWNFLKNQRDTSKTKTVTSAEVFFKLRTWLEAQEHKGTPIITLDVDGIPHRNLVFSFVDRSGIPRQASTEADHVALFEFLIGQRTADDLAIGTNGPPSNPSSFKFGIAATGTTIVQAFPDGLMPEFVTCSLIEDPFAVPQSIELLVDRAHAVLQSDAPGIQEVNDRRFLAPRQFAVRIVEAEFEDKRVAITFADSSYRYYAAFAFAELLALYSSEFVPLAAFVKDTPHPRKPAPATCSMGVRVLLETTDRRLVVAHRSDQVKLNPNVWSASANEGIRRSLLKPGRDCADLLTVAVYQALSNELRIDAHECESPVLLSIYRNAFNQWGAGFTIKTSLESSAVISRQKKADEAFEHGKMAVLPLSLEHCGQAMRNLGERWYGGALETICQYFALRELQSGRYFSPDDIGTILSRGAGGSIKPIDQANAALLPTK
jgi:hypothetical protein